MTDPTNAAAPPPVMGEPPPGTEAPLPPPPIPVNQDDAFMHLMLENQKQGLKLAQVQNARGQRPDVRRLAQSMISNHNAEIERLKRAKGR